MNSNQGQVRAISPTVCAVCGDRTLGYIVSVAGGTRALTAGTRRSRKLYCRPCGEARIAQIQANEIRLSGGTR